MKKIFILLLAVMPLAISAQNLKAVPEVSQWTATEGQTAVSGRIVCKSKSLTAVAERLAADLKANGIEASVAKGSPKDGDITLTLKADKKANAESYRIEIGKTVNIIAPSELGAQWACQTLLQNLQTKGDRLPQGTIVDEPQYAVRGFMIDCGRKFFPMSYLKDLVRDMAYYKMNTLQVHLNDNGFNYWFGDDWNKTQAAFRMESDFFPGLTATDGHYTKQEMREFIRYAASLGVEVIPEIDVPAHSLAFTRYRPSLAKPEFGMDHLNITDPAVVQFIDSLFIEYCAGPDPVFCCPRVHIGTDEFNNSKPEFREAFRSLTDHLIRLVESYGKQAVVWGSLSHAYGETPVKVDNVLMSMWSNGFAKPKDMKELGYQMISIPDGYVYIVPAAGYYYDYLNCEWLYNTWTPANIGGVQFDEQDPSIAGGMFAVWNDHPGNGITVQDVHDRVMPALQTLAAKCWSGATAKASWQDFKALCDKTGEAPAVDAWGQRVKAMQMSEVTAGEPFCPTAIERGYPYEVSLTVDCKPEERGTVLLTSPNSTVYLSDPLQGKVGFEREGYVHQFNYRLPAEGRVTLTFRADRNGTTLLVNGEVKGKLEREPLYVLNKNPRNHVQTLPGSNAIVADATVPARTMYYVHTLFFPLQKAGNFKSRVSDFKLK